MTPEPEAAAPQRVFVAGASGWLGRNVVEAAVAQGMQVTALVRASSDTSGVLQHPSVRLVVGDVCDPGSIQQEWFEGVAYVVSVLGLRSMAVTDEELWRVLRDGMLAVFRHAAATGSMRRFALVAGGIHTTPEGLPCRGMDHNTAREAAIDEIRKSCKAAAAEGGGITWTAVDASVYFKDVGRFFDAAVQHGRITMVGRHAFDGVRFNPISGRDLADFMVHAMRDPALANRRVRVGGPEVLTFRQLAAAIGQVLGREVPCTALPVLPAKAVVATLRAAARATQSRRLLGLYRFLYFVLLVSLDETEESLVGRPWGKDNVEDYLRQRAAEMAAKEQDGGAGGGQPAVAG